MPQIQIHYSGTDRSDALDAQVRERIESDLQRFGSRVTRVEVHLTDENADKGGPQDKKCVMEAHPAAMQPVAVTHHGSDLFHVARESSEKLGRLLARRFDKHDAVG